MTDWSNVLRDEQPEWFRDTPFGIFLHWGAYSVPGWAEPIGELGTIDDLTWFKHNPYAEWYANTIRIEGSPAAEHHREVWGGRPYDDFLDLWTAERLDVDEWMRLFVDAGAGYVIPTSKHHDGIALWDAPGTGDRNTVHRGPRRDLIGELGEAARRHGLRYGIYYSGGFDWHAAPTAPIVEDADATRPIGRDYADLCYDHCVDLIDRYRPDILWNDINWPDEGKGFGPRDVGTMMLHYRQVVPDGLLNDRWGVPAHDYRTSEYEAARDAEEAPVWEHCRGIGLSFGWNQVEGPEHYLDGAAIARHLVDCVSRGGHLLLNLGPRADGTFGAENVGALQQLARWMAVARDLVRIPDQRSEAEAEAGAHAEAWVRRIEGGQGTAVFLDGADEVRLPERVTAVAWAEVTDAGSGSLVRLDPERPGPAIVMA